MNSNNAPPRRANTLPAPPAPLRQARKVARAWSRRRRPPLPLPRLDAGLPFWPWYERIPVVLLYFLLKWERWISPNGSLRRLVRASLALALTIVILVVILAPAFLALLTALNLSTSELLAIATHISLTSEEGVKILVNVLAMVGVLIVLRLLLSGNLLVLLFLLGTFFTGWWRGWLPF